MNYKKKKNDEIKIITRTNSYDNYNNNLFFKKRAKQEKKILIS